MKIKKPLILNRINGFYFLNGGAEGDRTPDLTAASRTLSQLSYSPTNEKRYCLKSVGLSIKKMPSLGGGWDNPYIMVPYECIFFVGLGWRLSYSL